MGVVAILHTKTVFNFIRNIIIFIQYNDLKNIVDLLLNSTKISQGIIEHGDLFEGKLQYKLLKFVRHEMFISLGPIGKRSYCLLQLYILSTTRKRSKHL